MGFWNNYPNRKDWRKKSRKYAKSCMNHGGCPYCESNRMRASRRSLQAAKQKLWDYLTNTERVEI
jgi:hypothetical protein